MSSHPNRVPVLNIYQGVAGTWWWECWKDHEDDEDWFDRHGTHAEALAAALDHCHKKEAS